MIIAVRSSPSQIDYSVEQMSDDLLQLLDHLEIKCAGLIGHSTGGAIGQTLALDQPDRIGKLVLSATWSAADDYFKRLFQVRGEILSEGGVEAYVRSNAVFMFPPHWIRDKLALMLPGEKDAISAFPKPEIMAHAMISPRRLISLRSWGVLSPTLRLCSWRQAGISFRLSRAPRFANIRSPF